MQLTFEQLTTLASSNNAVGTVPEGAYLMYAQAEAQVVRVRLDGTAPTSTVGFRLIPGAPPTPFPVQGAAPKFIQEAAGGKVNLNYWG